jgi:hypothetical protein
MGRRRNEELLEELVGRVSTRRANAIRTVQKTRVDVAAADAQRAAQAAQAAIDEADLPTDDGLAPADPLGAAVFVAKDAATGGVRVEFSIANPGGPDYVRRAQVRWRKTGATTWTVEEADPDLGLSPMLSVGTLSPTDVIEAQVRYVDFFGRASNWTPDPPKASVEETYFPYLRADRIRSGTITAEALTLAGSASPASLTLIDSSYLQVYDTTTGANRIKVSNEGLEVRQSDVAGSFPADQVGQALFPLGGNRHSAIWPFSDSTALTRGWNVRSDGISGSSMAGLTQLVATSAPGTGNETVGGYASLRLLGANLTNLAPFGSEVVAGAQIRHALRIRANNVGAGGHLRVEGKSYLAGFVETGGAILAGSTITAGAGSALRIASPAGVSALDLAITSEPADNRIRLVSRFASFRFESLGYYASGLEANTIKSYGTIEASGAVSALRFVPQFVETVTISAGQSKLFAHGFGVRPGLFQVEAQDTDPNQSNRWYRTDAVSWLRVRYHSDVYVVVENADTVARTVRCIAYRVF